MSELKLEDPNQAGVSESGDTGGGTSAIEENRDGQPGQTGTSGEKLADNLPPELETKHKELLKAFHEKTQKLADDRRQLELETARYKQDAEVLYGLADKQWFKKAIEDEKARRSGASMEISDDDLEAARTDNKAFRELLSRRDKAITESLRSEFKPEFDKLTEHQKELVTEREFDTVAEEYGADFRKANDEGLLDPYLNKGLDYESAFKLLEADNGRLAKKASRQESLISKRSGSIEKTGMATTRGGPVHKVRNLDEAISRALELASRGQKDYRLEKA